MAHRYNRSGVSSCALLRVYHIPAHRCLILSQTVPLGMGQSVVDGQRLERCLLHVLVSQPTDHFHCDSLCHVKEACASKMVVFSSVVLWVRSRALEHGCCFSSQVASAMLDNEAVFNVSRRRLDVKHQRVPVARADHYVVGLLLFMLLGLRRIGRSIRAFTSCLACWLTSFLRSTGLSS